MGDRMRAVELELEDSLFAMIEAMARERGISVRELIRELVAMSTDDAVDSDGILGMLADDPELADALSEQALGARERDPLRI